MSQKIIVFEGPDNTFKSPLAKKLSEKINVPLFKNKQEKELFREQDAYYYEFRYSQSYITQFLNQTKYSIILDRSWPSQFVYSKITNRKFDYDHWLKIDKDFSEMNTFVFITYRKDYSRCIDDLFSNQEIIKQDSLYRQFDNESCCKNIFWLHTGDVQSDSDLEEIINQQILSQLNR